MTLWTVDCQRHLVQGAGFSFACQLGRSGVVAERDKREGDGKTALGEYRLLTVWYRADRLDGLQTALPTRAIQRDDGWCDDVRDTLHYNRHIKLPYAGSHENLWREDEVYDLIVVTSHNQDPVVVGAGSALFVHVMRTPPSPTAGCVALARADLLTLLKHSSAQSVIRLQ